MAGPLLLKHISAKTQKDARSREQSLILIAEMTAKPVYGTPNLIDVMKNDPSTKLRALAQKTLVSVTKQNFPQNRPDLWEKWYQDYLKIKTK